MKRLFPLLACAWVFWHQAMPMKCTRFAVGDTFQTSCIQSCAICGTQNAWEPMEEFATKDACLLASKTQATSDHAANRALEPKGATSEPFYNRLYGYKCLPSGIHPKQMD